MAYRHLACMIIPVTLAAATPDVGAAARYREVAPPPPPPPPPTVVSIDDSDIRRAIEARLERQEGVEARRIDVAVEDGVVTLRGVIASLLAHERVIEIARGTRGVRSILDRVRVLPQARADAEIQKDAREQLDWKPWLDAKRIEVRVYDGIAILSGSVASWFEVEQARREAFEAGARSVRSRLRVEPGASSAG